METISFWLDWLPAIIGRIAIIAWINAILGVSRRSWRVARIARIGRVPIVRWYSLWRVALRWICCISLRRWISGSLPLGGWMVRGLWCRRIRLSLLLRWGIGYISWSEERGIRWIGRECARDMFAVGRLGIDSFLLRWPSWLFSCRW